MGPDRHNQNNSNMPAWIPPAIAGITSLIGGMINRGGQKKSDERYNMEQRMAQRMQNKHNIQFWNMQNAYNHPKEQMQRLQEAGLNPNLMYGMGSAGNAESISPAKAPDTRASNLAAPLAESVGQLPQRALETDNLVKIGKKIDADASKSRAEARDKEVDADIRESLKQDELAAKGAQYEYDAKKAMNDALNYEDLTHAQRQRLIADTKRIEAATSLAEVEKAIKEYHRDSWKDGINPMTPKWERILWQFIENSKWFKDLKEKVGFFTNK